jgi:hypothetical protein
MTLKDMVIAQLKAKGADGLCNEACGCRLDDLMPCGEPHEDCVAAKQDAPTAEEKSEWGDEITWMMREME